MLGCDINFQMKDMGNLNIKPSNLSWMKKSLALGLDHVVVKTKLCKDEGR